MSGTVITVCASCGAGLALAPALAEALAEEAVRAGGPGAVVRETDCMSGCTRPGTVAFRAPGKTAYLFGDLGPADIADLCRFARLYHASDTGTFADARPLGALRLKAIARIPG